MEEVDKKTTYAQALKASGQQKLQEDDKKIAEDDKKIQESLTRAFYSIFNGKKPLPAEEVDKLFSTYLADESISVTQTPEGKNCPKLNSMKIVTRYLDEHKDVKSCDFRLFKTELPEVKTLADYLSQSSCTVKAIAINRTISKEAQQSLNEAIATKKDLLKVQYFD